MDCESDNFVESLVVGNKEHKKRSKSPTKGKHHVAKKRPSSRSRSRSHHKVGGAPPTNSPVKKMSRKKRSSRKKSSSHKRTSSHHKRSPSLKK